MSSFAAYALLQSGLLRDVRAWLALDRSDFFERPLFRRQLDDGRRQQLPRLSGMLEHGRSGPVRGYASARRDNDGNIPSGRCHFRTAEVSSSREDGLLASTVSCHGQLWLGFASWAALARFEVGPFVQFGMIATSPYLLAAGVARQVFDQRQ